MALVFDEVRFPEDILWGVVGGPQFNTTVLETTAGFEYRNRNWTHPLRSWNVGHAVRTQEEVDILAAFFRARDGRRRGFRFKDWSDYKHDMSLVPTRVSCYPALSDGVRTTFQVVKSYTSGGITYLRPITKIDDNGSFKLYFAGGDITATRGIVWQLDPDTGLVTFLTGPPVTGNALEWEGEFDVPVRFNVDDMAVSIDHFMTYSWDSIGLVEVRDTPQISVPQTEVTDSFHMVVLPDKIAFGVTGGPGFKTLVFESRGGVEARGSNWSVQRAKYALAQELKEFDDYVALVDFFHARWGRAFGFLFKDWSDFATTTQDPRTGLPAIPATGIAFGKEDVPQNVQDSANVTFQLTKAYTSTNSYVRTITKPKLDTVRFWKDAVEFTRVVGAPAATQFSVDDETGLITLNAADAPAPADDLTWEGEFYVPVRFNSDKMEIEMVNYGYFNWNSIELMELR